MDDRLAVALRTADGTTFRWGADQPDAKDIPRGLQFTTSDPGGFKDATVSLPRRIDVDFPDLTLFDDWRIYGPGAGETAFEGRTEQTPRSHGDDFAIQAQAVGWAAHLRDDPTFREIYVDREVSRWGEMSNARRVALGIAWHVRNSPQVRFDYVNGVPCVELSLDRLAATAGTVGEAMEAWYDGNGLVLDSCYYDVATSHAFSSGAGWDPGMVFGADDTGGGPYTVAAFTGGTSFTGTLNGTGSSKAIQLRLNFSATLTQDGVWYLQLRRPAVFGGHGLTKRGAAPLQGFYASDVIADVVGRAAPRLKFTTGDGGSIEPTNYPIPHLVFLEPVTAEDAILATNAFHQRSWGVEDDKTFFYRSTGNPRRRWRCRLSDGAQMDLAGPQAENAINGVIVRFEGPAGVQETAGPPGSGCKTESALLVDSDSSNPATSHGLKRWAIVDLSFVTTGGATGGAVQVGAAYLREVLSNMNVRGDVTVKGWVVSDTGVAMPAWAVRGGDTITVEDADNVERRIIESSYDHDTRTNALSLDTTAHRVDALMERMGVALVGAV